MKILCVRTKWLIVLFVDWEIGKKKKTNITNTLIN
jgi:hypothetical protein